MKKILPITAWSTFAVLAILIGLYVSFVYQIRNSGEPTQLARADAIVVLTGEDNRIVSAVRLLTENQGDRLLISGVNRNVSRETLKHSIPADAATFSCCIDLDYQAMDTRGNAKNASYWAKYHDFQKLIIVTSDYHMPRSILMLERAMPHIQLQAMPVPSPTVTEATLADLITSPLLITEFGKYLIAQLGMEPAAKYLMMAAIQGNTSGKPG
ncbi:MAG: YdcF family protein [Rhizobiaceae bacterium]